MKVCKFEGCQRAARSRGWCDTHYRRWARWGDPSVVAKTGRKPKAPQWPQCDVEGCTNQRRNGGLCDRHDRQERDGWPSVVSCGVCGKPLGVMPDDGDPWAAFGAHRCRRAS